ncbi:hypothetical protein E2562_027700 [Oryza meyeriana var. granulata]|uniref:Uncharacterized protein n=1 Tax=Oryza meyeriana var. granulata TaxID=110450 RepID=A0A6G1CS16_9ORYZ|nr:hypothetical protein E2562_027700 [Oryza meyeriana var. granulata]
MKGLRSEVAKIKTLLKELCSKRGEGDPEKRSEGENVNVETSQGPPVVVTDGDARNNRVARGSGMNLGQVLKRPRLEIPLFQGDDVIN